MNKIIKYTLYISILLVYNITTVYAAVSHNHDFSWEYEESCSAYVLSISLISDTYPFSIDSKLAFATKDFIKFHNKDTFTFSDYWKIFSGRAPPSV